MLVELKFKQQNDRILVTCDGTDVITESSKHGTQLILARREGVGIYWARMLDNLLHAVTEWEEDITYPGWPYFHFGGLEKGQAHYYRVQGPTFLIEYDNIQNDVNHIHIAWRDFDGDFGADLISAHYAQTFDPHRPLVHAH